VARPIAFDLAQDASGDPWFTTAKGSYRSTWSVVERGTHAWRAMFFDQIANRSNAYQP
jgi:hypothetical protein